MKKLVILTIFLWIGISAFASLWSINLKIKDKTIRGNNQIRTAFYQHDNNGEDKSLEEQLKKFNQYLTKSYYLPEIILAFYDILEAKNNLGSFPQNPFKVKKLVTKQKITSFLFLYFHAKNILESAISKIPQPSLNQILESLTYQHKLRPQTIQNIKNITSNKTTLEKVFFKNLSTEQINKLQTYCNQVSKIKEIFLYRLVNHLTATFPYLKKQLKDLFVTITQNKALLSLALLSFFSYFIKIDISAMSNSPEEMTKENNDIPNFYFLEKNNSLAKSLTRQALACLNIDANDAFKHNITSQTIQLENNYTMKNCLLKFDIFKKNQILPPKLYEMLAKCEATCLNCLTSLCQQLSPAARPIIYSILSPSTTTNYWNVQLTCSPLIALEEIGKIKNNNKEFIYLDGRKKECY